jgi:uncharacterized protein YjdB
MTLEGRALNDAGKPIDSLRVFWSSSDAGVASVNDGGLVTARGPGEARIAATALGRSAVARVTVIRVSGVPSIPQAPTPPPPAPPASAPPPAPAAVAAVTVSLRATTLREGSTTTAAVTLRSAAGAVLTGRTVTWKSESPSIASVSSSGLVTGKKKGSARISATSEGKQGSASVKVEKK